MIHLGLHTDQEQARALERAALAYERAVVASERRDAVAIAFEIGYIKAIADLAAEEGAPDLARLTGDQVRRLDALLLEIQ